MKVSGSGMRRSVLVVAMVGALTVGAGGAGGDLGAGRGRYR
jgi:hypothetical protein